MSDCPDDFTKQQVLHLLMNEIERLSKFTIKTEVRDQICELFCGEEQEQEPDEVPNSSSNSIHYE